MKKHESPTNGAMSDDTLPARLGSYYEAAIPDTLDLAE